MIKIPRLPQHGYWMLQAHLTATRSTCDRGPELLFDPERHGVGAILVRDNRMIAGGYAGSPPGQPHCDDVGHLMIEGHCHRTLHSEMNALLQCALDQTSPAGAFLYTTAAPCYDCAKALIRAKVVAVFYSETYESRYGLSKASFALLKTANIGLHEVALFWGEDGSLVAPLLAAWKNL